MRFFEKIKLTYSHRAGLTCEAREHVNFRPKKLNRIKPSSWNNCVCGIRRSVLPPHLPPPFAQP